MRRKSKKVKEEAKVDSSSERRSKRASSRRKKTHDDDEGGSGAEEGRTTEEENQTKGRDRGNRRYATRGRKHKVEESEEEESQNEEGVDGDEESSNTYPVGTEADDGDEQAADSDDDSKGLKSASGVADTASAEIDESSACNSDNQYKKMRTGKNDQEDKRSVLPGETLAHGEGDDGEEGVSRSHSRKKKLKLSRECLHENREAIPKIRLRLSRNRSGGYETEKVEAERIDDKTVEEGPVVEVIKVTSFSEEVEEKEEAQISLPSETVETVVAEEEVSKSEVVASEVSETDNEQLISGEMEAQDRTGDEIKAEVEDTGAPEEAIPDNINVKKEPEEEDSPQAIEEADSSGIVTLVKIESIPSCQVEKTGEAAQAEIENPLVIEEDVKIEFLGFPLPVEEMHRSPSPPIKEEMEEEEQAVSGEKVGDVASEVKEERREEEEKEVVIDQVSTSDEVEDAKKDEGEGKAVAEGNVEVPVGGAAEEGAESMEVEKEESNDKEADGDEGPAVDEVSVPMIIENDAAEDKEKEKDKKSDERQQNEGDEVAEVQRRESDSLHKGGSGEKVSRINRSRLRQDDDKDEDGQSQKRRSRRKRSQSGGEESSGGTVERQQVPVAAPEQLQPKRVTLKRPKLIRTTSSSSTKEKDSEGNEQQSGTSIGTEVDEKKENDNAVAETLPDNKEEMLEDEKSQEPKKGQEDEVIRKRRRKWGQNKSQTGPSQSRRAFISISSLSLKGLIPEVKPLPIHELRLSIEKDDIKDICMEEEESCEGLGDETIVRMIDTNGQNERTVWAQVVDDDMRPTVHPEAPRVPTVGSGDLNVSTGPVRRISIVSDDAVRLQRSPSPPRHPPSNVLFLSNLVRPFTVQQLKELLARTGTVVEDGFWIDRIKSMCLVQYETEEQAKETRHALHGVRWPISNPKRLWVDFSTKEKLEEAKREGNVPPLPSASGQSTSPHSTLRDDFPRKTEPLRMDGSGLGPTHPSHRGAPGSPGRQGHSINLAQGQVAAGGQAGEGDAEDNVGWQQRGRPRPEPPPLRPGANAREFKMSAPIREWDLDKVVQQSPPRPGVHGPLHGGTLDDRRRPDAAGQPSGHRDRAMPSPPASVQDLQARKAKRKEAEAAAAAAAEAPANLLDSLFRKTKATPSIYWLPLTADQIKVKEEIRRQHLAEHERRMAEMKRAAAKERAGRRRRRSSSPRRRSRRRSGGEESGAVRKRPSESMKGRKAGSASPKK